MIGKSVKLLALLILVSTVVYIVSFNSEKITIYLSSANSLTARTGVVLIAVFALGFLCAALLASYFGIKSALRERRLKKTDKDRLAFYEEMLVARSYTATHEWQKAIELWGKIIKKDPTDIIAHVELSKALLASGNAREALKSLDAARAKDPSNVEVLFEAAELNNALNNKTVAIDNLALISYNHPNLKAVSMARDLSEQLDRIEDALEYQQKVESFGGAPDDEEVVARLEFKKLQKEQSASVNQSDNEAYKKNLKRFIKQNPQFVPAMEELAKIEESEGATERAAQLLIQAGKTAGAANYWYAASKLWISHDMADNALSAVKSAVRETQNEEKLEALTNYIKVAIGLGKLEDAKRAIERFNNEAKDADITVHKSAAKNLLILKGLCLNRLKEYKEAAEVWVKLSKYDFDLQDSEKEAVQKSTRKAPPPRLSTP